MRSGKERYGIVNPMSAFHAEFQILCKLMAGAALEACDAGPADVVRGILAHVKSW